MKKNYTRLFLIFIFLATVSNLFAEALIRQDDNLGIPAAPVNVAAEAMSASQITIKWEYNEGEEKVNHFFVKRIQETVSPNFEEIARVNKHTRSVTDENLSPATTYQYRVIASGPTGDSEPSALAEATTFPAPLATPNPPTSLTATGINATTIRLTWEHDQIDTEKIVIERGLLNIGPFNKIGEVPAEISTYDDSDNLLPLITYYYRVKAANADDESLYSNVASATTDLFASAPSAPSDLMASEISATSIVLNWNDNSNNEEAFIIERGLTAAGPFTAIEEEVGPNVETATDADLTPNTPYFYTIKAVNEAGSSAATSPIETITLDVVPAAPSDLVANPLSSTSIGLQWSDNSSNESSFVLERATEEAGPYDPRSLDANLEAHTDTELSSNTTYYYRLKASNIIGDSEYTPVVSAKTNEVIPAAPSGLQITGKTASTITLGWTDNSTNETAFVLERSATSASTGFVGIVATAANITSFEDTELAANTTYYYRIKARNAEGDSEYNATSGATNDVAPAAPSGLQVTAKTASTITLGWTDNSTNETAFVLERSATSASTGFTEIEATAANTTTFEDTGLASNTTYYYRVKARNAVGDSEYSGISAKTNDVAPAAPSGLQITSQTAHTINLSWTDNSNNEANFVLEKSVTSSTSGFSLEATLPANTTAYEDTELTSNTTYYYRVKATNTTGESVYSTASGKTDTDLPLSPSNLTVGEISTSSIALSWTDNSNNETGFEVARSLQGSTGFSLIAELPANSKSFLDEGLESNTTYFYKVRAVNADGASSYGTTVSATTEREAGPPAPPSLLTATAITTFQINLSWQDNSDNETSFVVERSLSETGPFSAVATLPANSSFYENTGLEASTTYYYRVKAKNIDGEPVSNISSATTKANPTPPTAPTGLSAVAVSTVQINLTWIDNSNSETNFTIQRSKSLDGPYQLVASVGANVTSYQNFGLESNTTYYYRVRAESGDGVSAFTNIDNARTFEAAKPPAAPSSLTAKGVSTIQINLEWIDNSNSETNFVIERSNTTDGPYSFIAAVGANVTSYQNTGLSAGTKYFYKVRAINNDGTSDFSNTASATTPIAGQAPVPPSGLEAIGVSTTQINLTWVDNSENETNFAIHRSSSQDGSFSFLVSLPANQVTYENTGLEPNTTYYYKVLASNIDGNSAFSGVAQGTTSEQPQPPAAPDGLTALAVSTTQITLKWNDKAFNETSYEIERATNGENFDRVGTVDANDTVFQNFGLAPNTEYTYRVRAQNGDGVSEYSNVATAVTLENKVPPIAPSDLFVKALSQSEVELFWTDNSVNEEEFIVERAELEADPTAANFVIVEILPSNTTTFIDSGLKPNTTYKYRIQAKNSDGITYSNEFVIITSIGGNPVIIIRSDSPPYPDFFSNQDEDTVISIKVAEPELYESVSFHYRGITEGNYNTDIPVTINGNEYSVTIAKEALDEMGVEYYFEALDAEDNPAVSAKGYTYWKMENPGLTLPDLKFGETVNDYQMISIPLVLDANRIIDVLEDDLGAYDPTKWRLFHYENGDKLERGDFIDISPGKAYWLIIKESDTLNTGAGNVVEVHNGEPFELQLNPGWNQIGNPYMFEISWNEVLLANDNPQSIGPLYTYDGTYSESQTLGVFKGAYVHSEQSVKIVFPIGVQEENGAGRYASSASGKFQADKKEGFGWDIDFKLSAKDLVYNLAGLGMHTRASKSKDQFDRIALPKLPSYVDINFEHPEYLSPQFTKDIVPLQESYIWDMQVVSSFGNSPVTISWKKADQLPDGMNLILYDSKRQKRIDMKLENSYEVTGEVPLQVFYGNDKFIAENLQPKTVYVGTAYPNPFSEALTIPLSLPVADLPYTVNVHLYNNVGKQLVKPYHFTVEGGFRDVQLAGAELQSLNNGLYFYKIVITQDKNLIKEAVGRVLKK